MRYKVLKSSLDGISGGASSFASIDDVLREIAYHKGWPSVEALHASIREWSAVAKPGDVFCTQVTAIVAVAIDSLDVEDDVCPHCGHEGLDYGDMDPVEGGDVEQKVECPACGARWQDVFTLTERRTLCREDGE